MSNASENVDPLADDLDGNASEESRIGFGGSKILRWLTYFSVASFAIGVVCSTIAGNTRSPDTEALSTAVMRLSLTMTVSGLVGIMLFLRRASLIGMLKGINDIRTFNRPFARLVVLNIVVLLAVTLFNGMLFATVPTIATCLILFLAPAGLGVMVTASVFAKTITKAYLIGFVAALCISLFVLTLLWELTGYWFVNYASYSTNYSWYENLPNPGFLIGTQFGVFFMFEVLIAYSMLSGLLSAGIAQLIFFAHETNDLETAS